MRYILLLSVLATFVLTGCEKASTAANANKDNNTSNSTVRYVPGDEAPRITLADAKKDFDAGTAIFVDTRAQTTYDTGHIKGAINIPAESAEARYKEIPTDKKIIAYCS